MTATPVAAKASDGGDSIDEPYAIQMATDGVEAMGLEVQTQALCAEGVYNGPKEPIPLTGATASSNAWASDYGRWSSPSHSAIRELADGGFERVEYVASTSGNPQLIIETYDPDFKFVEAAKIPTESFTPVLADCGQFLWGGIYCGISHNYVLTGLTNSDEDDSRPVMRLTQYDPDWHYETNVEVAGINTRVPFDAGNARFAEDGDTLYLRTCHEMYTSSDGLNHQANMTFSIAQDPLKMVNGYWSVLNLMQTAYGYVSHSFNQFVQVFDDQVYGLDHGDANPRSVVVKRFGVIDNPYAPAQAKGSADIFEISGPYGENYTGVTVDGFTNSATSDSLITLGSSVDQKSSFGSSRTYNLWLAVTPTSNLHATKLVWLTDYPEGGDKSVYGAKICKLSDDRFLVTWGFDGDDDLISYVFVDGNGNELSDTSITPGKTSDCDPIAVNGKAVWYATGTSYGYGSSPTKPVFYEVDGRTGALARHTEAVPIYRLYNPNTKEHLYTTDANEMRTLSSPSGGWNYEGEDWTSPAASETPIYRLYNPNTGDHMYTKDLNEYNTLRNVGWNGEDIKFYSDDDQGTPVFRLHNPYNPGAGSHLYTTDANERNSLVRQGWEDENIAFYGLA